MLEDSLATVYTKLWYLSDEATLPVSVVYELADLMPNGELAYFAPHLDDRPFPHIRIAPPACADGDELDVAGADILELISLAHERGHEASWRSGTYEVTTMAEKRRAWDHARELLHQLELDSWAAFEGTKRESLEAHWLRGTAEE
jgi:hypothetical protein